MPISFYHGFEAAEPATTRDYPVVTTYTSLLAYLDAREAVESEDTDSGQHIALRLETKLVRLRAPQLLNSGIRTTRKRLRSQSVRKTC